jgi:hypothetical protein
MTNLKRIITTNHETMTTTLCGLLVLIALALIFMSLGRSYTGVCIFDLTTIMDKDFKPYPFALDAQRMCILKGHEIAAYHMNSIDPSFDFERKFLQTNFPTIWTPTLLGSHAAQIGASNDQEKALKDIASYYEKPGHCMVLISGHYESEKFTEKLGIELLEAGAAGISKTTMDKAFSTLLSKCSTYDPVPPVKHPCDDKPPDSVFTCSRQKKWGKCSEKWIEGYCRYSCHNCVWSATNSTTKVTVSNADQ